MPNSSSPYGGIFISEEVLFDAAKIIQLIALNCRKHKDPCITRTSRQSPEYRYYFKALSDQVRHIEYFLAEHRVSEKAQKLATEMRIGELKFYAWRDQTSKMKDPKRKIFHFEHIKPCAQIRDEILALEKPKVSEIVSILKTSDVAWILKEEQKLIDKKYRNHRPDPYRCLSKSGINLLA
ncbi:hypothetical protein [Hirschia baltica]|uniref:Uncharacterized protein n=1 Tax=Hirschia baltica (strain ATCC 49814 / DSM 5838 / IFAM 1418) TaxID=582402 RepID=C6XN74_HIRBI|nr:hypothetical protein [Hirschia baltica]ACT58244.1 hypothetical protein Hbal_0542 [Hirschia baltica ATCC 49814]